MAFPDDLNRALERSHRPVRSDQPGEPEWYFEGGSGRRSGFERLPPMPAPRKPARWHRGKPTPDAARARRVVVEFDAEIPTSPEAMKVLADFLAETLDQRLAFVQAWGNVRARIEEPEAPKPGLLSRLTKR